MQKIAVKMVKIIQEIKNVRKTGINEYHKHAYVTASDVLEKVNAALTKYGIMSIAVPELVDMREVKTAKGNLENLATVVRKGT